MPMTPADFVATALVVTALAGLPLSPAQLAQNVVSLLLLGAAWTAATSPLAAGGGAAVAAAVICFVRSLPAGATHRREGSVSDGLPDHQAT